MSKYTPREIIGGPFGWLAKKGIGDQLVQLEEARMKQELFIDNLARKIVGDELDRLEKTKADIIALLKDPNAGWKLIDAFDRILSRIAASSNLDAMICVAEDA